MWRSWRRIISCLRKYKRRTMREQKASKTSRTTRSLEKASDIPLSSRPRCRYNKHHHIQDLVNLVERRMSLQSPGTHCHSHNHNHNYNHIIRNHSTRNHSSVTIMANSISELHSTACSYYIYNTILVRC